MAGRRVANHGTSSGASARDKPQRPRGSGRREVKTAPPSVDVSAGLPMLRNSERSAIKRCEFLWDLTYNRKLKPWTDAPALRFGSLVHGALACYYVPGVKRGEHPALAFERLYEEDLRHNEEVFGLRVEEEDKWVNARELGIAMMNNYVDEYGADDSYEVLATEMPFQTLVTYPQDVYREFSIDGEPHKQGDPWFWVVGVVDGVWRHRGDKTVWVPDHKTTAGIGDKNWKHLTVDDQAGTYWSYGAEFLLLKGFLKRNQQLNGMLYNIMRKAMPDERASKFQGGRRVYLNLDGTVSKKQPSQYFKRVPVFRDQYDREEAMRRMIVDYRRIQLFRSGALELSKHPGQFTCPGCPMIDACELHETGHDWESFLSQTTQGWNPYDAHEIYDGR